MNTTLSELYLRELNALKQELNLYKQENDLWKVEKDISNSAGNLTLHIIGNLKHYFGACLANNGYVRNRDDEFAIKNIPLNSLLSDIDECIHSIQQVLNTMNNTKLNSEFPGKFLNETRSISYVILHLLAHLSYHRGQINYHRRLI